MILCSGNPNDQTVASAVRRLWPEASFASRATGYDLRFWTPGSEDFFKKTIINYHVFINSSFICGNGQLQLLETTHETWANAGICGHIINIGSTAEYIGVHEANGVYATYSIQKRSLRDRSLQLNGKNNIRTSHIIAGGLNDGKPENSHCLDLNYLANVIKWILDAPYDMPLLQIESKRI